MSTQFRAKILGFAAAAALVAGASVPAQAHHSFAMYDVTKTLTLTGRLTRFIPGANHAQLLFELVDERGETILGDDGKPVVWGVETAPAATIARQGVTVKAFPVGTIITVTLNPLRDGRNFGALANGARIVKCGMEMPEGGCTPETGEVFLEDDDAS
ncbi:MAG TPA: DUF6152 family protein [Gammaproteobacteria bacterium]